MKFSRYQLNKWIKRYVLKSKDVLWQGIGQAYSVAEVKGYYNDLREKVTKGEDLAPEELPLYYTDKGEKFLFSIGIMQYGLACYDLYLTQQDLKMKDKMLLCADWAVENIRENGGWETFAHLYPERPYSAMAQGEGVSLLVRAYIESEEKKYLEAAKKAVYFMLVPVEHGGVAISSETELVLKEYTERPIVMNGWIFALWGLLDYIKLTKDETIKAAYEKSLATLEQYIPHYDLGYWTRYDYSVRIASPFYHRLHMDQFSVMYELTGHEVFKTYLDRFRKYEESFWCRNKALLIKAAQKISGK